MLHNREGGAMAEGPVAIKPKLHHVGVRTARLEEMIEWYSTVLGAEVVQRHEAAAWLTTDDASHRIALLALGSFSAQPAQPPNGHHWAFEYDSFDDLNASYLRLREGGIAPAACLDQGMTFSYHYIDPDGNTVELHTDTFGDWSRSKEWMSSSTEFRESPIGQFVDPELVAGDRAAGVGFAEIHAKAMAGGYVPTAPPAELPPA
jgi:catechol-2,3-dioxygenase